MGYSQIHRRLLIIEGDGSALNLESTYFVPNCTHLLLFIHGGICMVISRSVGLSH